MYNKRIQEAYNKLCQIRAECKKSADDANKLYATANHMYVEATKNKAVKASTLKLHAHANRLFAQANKIYAENNNLRNEGLILLYEAVISVFGSEKEVGWDGDDPIVDGWKYEENFQEPPTCEGKTVEIDGIKYKLTKV